MSVILFSDKEHQKMYNTIRQHVLNENKSMKYFLKIDYDRLMDIKNKDVQKYEELLISKTNQFMNRIKRANTSCWNIQYPNDNIKHEWTNFEKNYTLETMPLRTLYKELNSIEYNCRTNGGYETLNRETEEQLNLLKEAIAHRLIWEM